jgi:hypothetical protein
LRSGGRRGLPDLARPAHDGALGVEDPAAFAGSEDKKRRLFRDIYFQLERRIQIFTNLPIASLDRLSLQKRLDEIGRARAEAPAK